MDPVAKEWANSIASRIQFYAGGSFRPRRDAGFDWGSVDRSSSPFRRTVKSVANLLGFVQEAPDLSWLQLRASELWETRSILADETSRLLFDAVLVLRHVGHQRFAFPRLAYDPVLFASEQVPFSDPTLPHSYAESPLSVFTLSVNGLETSPSFRVVTTPAFMDAVNVWQQYTCRFEGGALGVREGDVAYDCGACIGDTSLLFGIFAGSSGHVHAIEPVPLHVRFLEGQMQLNEPLQSRFTVHATAVGGVDSSAGADAAAGSPRMIAPHYQVEEGCGVKSLDRLVHDNGGRCDFIKMDIEGMEMEALRGAQGTITRLKPRLAVCAYHTDDHLWEIPLYLRSLRPDMRVVFRHHSPVYWESVYYCF